MDGGLWRRAMFFMIANEVLEKQPIIAEQMVDSFSDGRLKLEFLDHEEFREHYKIFSNKLAFYREVYKKKIHIKNHYTFFPKIHFYFKVNNFFLN